MWLLKYRQHCPICPGWFSGWQLQRKQTATHYTLNYFIRVALGRADLPSCPVRKCLTLMWMKFHAPVTGGEPAHTSSKQSGGRRAHTNKLPGFLELPGGWKLRKPCRSDDGGGDGGGGAGHIMVISLENEERTLKTNFINTLLIRMPLKNNVIFIHKSIALENVIQ